MDRAAAELFLASSFVESTPERLAACKNAAANVKSFEGFVPALQHHGLVLLFQRNLGAAGVEPPPTLATQLTAGAGEARHAALRVRLTLQRFLAACAREGVEVTAIRGSALALGLYDEPLRTQRELELFVAPEHLARALRAAEVAGLAPAAGALPAWWYRHTHTTLPLRASSPHLVPVRLATRLHHPSLQLSVREPELVARRKRLSIEGHDLFVLDPLDALLELALHVASRAGQEPLTTGRRHLLTAVATSDAPLDPAELVDLRTFIERHHAAHPPAALVARAREWNAEAALCAVLECLTMGLGFLPAAREWTRAVAGPLAAAARPNPAVFFPDPFERLPHWLRPDPTTLARCTPLAGTPSTQLLRLARARHLLRAGLLGLFALVAFPFALLARQLSRSTREATFTALSDPAKQSDLAAAFKTTARVDDMKPITPRAIALEPREESASKYPDHYRG